MGDAHPTPPGTRERLIAAMADALQRRGLHGVGLAELLHTAQAPKGVLYHHFPGGKTELAVAAIDATVERLCATFDHLLQQQAEPVAALAQWLASAQGVMERSDFERGCPLATVALESTPQDVAIRAALARGFAALRERLAAFLAHAGIATERAAGLSTLVVAAYEGALMQSRVAGHSQALSDTSRMLQALLAAELPTPRP